MEPIAYIRSPFRTKFGVPRQSGLVNDICARVVLEPAYAKLEAIRGLSGFSHIWLIWLFHLSDQHAKRLTVRPPRLGGNQRMGVFATRSPFRPNPIGLSSVRLLDIEYDAHGSPQLIISGADLVDGTPIIDIKPYISSDSHPDASFGFTQPYENYRLNVDIPP